MRVWNGSTVTRAAQVSRARLNTDLLWVATATESAVMNAIQTQTAKPVHHKSVSIISHPL